uniref:Uncharacterized protein n=1 Tax=Chlorobium chlorochromatii (strain CaD3) TaxID=340177 RepID=Q3AS50_CHLCH
MIITPKVDETQEFIEIANDFSNPLDLVREAISNSFDANANKIYLSFDMVKEYMDTNLRIRIVDDGEGMTLDGLQSFFDLGNSTRRGIDGTIGEKGHGTKVYLNSSKISVKTIRDGKQYVAVMIEPIKKLYVREVPTVEVIESNVDELSGTTIEIIGYNSNRRGKFTHEQLKDYILWFTKFGSFESFFEKKENSHKRLFLKGLNASEYEEICFGHSFPNESQPVQRLFEEFLVSAPDYYCKRFVKRGQLKNSPEISFEAIFSVEGNRVKLAHNTMIQRQGRPSIAGNYKVAERYGVWVCKDFIPIQRKNEWVNYKGSEFIKLHAFFNCQGLRLTANRGSIDNTPSEVLSDIQEEIKKIYDEITSSDDWTQLSWLEQEAESYKTTEKEKKDFEFRLKKANKANICEFENTIIVEPQRESGVYALVLQLKMLKPDLFPFFIVDYDTHSGIDVIVKADDTQPIISSKLYYVEFKHYLTEEFNHSFVNLHSIICWDTTIKHNDILKDINGEERKMQIIPPESDGDYTKYFLDRPSSAHKIEVFVLKDYLKQKLGIEFRPRTAKDIL